MESDQDKTLVTGASQNTPEAAAPAEIDTVVHPDTVKASPVLASNIHLISEASRSAIQNSRAMTRTEKFDRGDNAAVLCAQSG